MERNYRLKLQRIGKYPFASLLQLLQYGANQSIWVFCVKWFLLNNQTTEKATELRKSKKKTWRSGLHRSCKSIVGDKEKQLRSPLSVHLLVNQCNGQHSLSCLCQTLPAMFQGVDGERFPEKKKKKQNKTKQKKRFFLVQVSVLELLHNSSLAILNI